MTVHAEAIKNAHVLFGSVYFSHLHVALF